MSASRMHFCGAALQHVCAHPALACLSPLWGVAVYGRQSWHACLLGMMLQASHGHEAILVHTMDCWANGGDGRLACRGCRLRL